MTILEDVPNCVEDEIATCKDIVLVFRKKVNEEETLTYRLSKDQFE